MLLNYENNNHHTTEPQNSLRFQRIKKLNSFTAHTLKFGGKKREISPST